MTVYTKLVRLRAPKLNNARIKSRTKRVDFIWYDYEEDVGEQNVQLVTTNMHPVLGSAGTMRHIDEELSYLPVCRDGVKKLPNTPTRAKQVDTIMGHPGLSGDRDYLKSKMKKVTDKWITKERLLQINANLRSMGYKKPLEVEEIRHHPTKPIVLYKVKIGEIESG